MKKYLIILMSMLFGLNSCHYLDVDPELGIVEEDIFSSYKNFKAYFNAVYEGTVRTNGSNYEVNLKLGFPLYADPYSTRFSFYAMTDAADCGRLTNAQTIKQGTMGDLFIQRLTTGITRRPISLAMFKIIRICNRTIVNIDQLRNTSQEDKDDLLGQAYFIRAYAHFVLVRYFGGMPYIDQPLEADDEWDLARLPSHETLLRCAEDYDHAYELLKAAGKMRRDAKPGEPGHLSSNEMLYPNAIAAKALKARALLYAASPLNNREGLVDWQNAAAACAEAISLAEEWGYEMVSFSRWSNNFYGTAYTNEQIWAWNYGRTQNSNTFFSGLFAYPQSGSGLVGGTCPTQNFVDMFETEDGYPLNTAADRLVAEQATSYKEQDPYSNRDPRFYKTILYDGAVVSGAPEGVNIYYDPETDSWPTTQLNGRGQTFGIPWGSRDGVSNQGGITNTGYYQNKWWDGNYGTAGSSHHFTDPLIRMAELYLNYAEAVNEAYGPEGTAGGLSLTALDAVNKVRKRAGMPNVRSEYSADPSLLRDRIRNERNVELAYEGHHYYFDIRRWMTAPTTMTTTLMGMYIEKTEVSAEYPKGRKYIRTPLNDNRQASWKPAMYYIPFPISEANKMTNFVNNEIW